MKFKFVHVITLLVVILSGCTNQETQKEIPITTSSDEALNLFLEARNDWELWEDTKAAELFDSAIELDPDFAMAYFYRALSGGGANVFNDNMEKAAALTDKVSPGEQLLIMIAMNRMDAKGTEMNILVDSLLQMYPEDKRVYYMLGAWNLNDDMDESIGYYEKALAIDENFFAVYPMLIDYYIDEKDYETARSYAEKFIENMPDAPEGYRRMGIVESAMGNDQEALEMLKKSAEIKHTEYIQTSIGQSYILLKEYDKARESFSKNLSEKEQLSTRFNAYVNIAISYLYERNEEAALETFGKMRALAEKEDVNATIVSSYFDQVFTSFLFKDNARLSAYLDQAEEAIQNLDLPERVLTYDQNTLLRWRGFEAIIRGDFESAANYYDQYAERMKGNNIDSEIKTANFDQGYLAYAEGNYEKAVEFYKKGFEGTFSDYYLALAYLGMEQPDLARPLLKKVAADRNVNMSNAFLVDWAKEKLKKLENG